MASTIWSFIVLLVIAGIVSPQVPSKGNCRTFIDGLNQLQMRGINVCSKKLGYTSVKEKLKKSACILKCVMQTAGMMNPDGSVSVAKLDQYINTHFPVVYRQRAHTTFKPCLALVKPVGAGNDVLCKSHDAFVKCMLKNFSQFCQGQQ